MREVVRAARKPSTNFRASIIRTTRSNASDNMTALERHSGDNYEVSPSRMSFSQRGAQSLFRRGKKVLSCILSIEANVNAKRMIIVMVPNHHIRSAYLWFLKKQSHSLRAASLVCHILCPLAPAMSSAELSSTSEYYLLEVNFDK